MAVMPDSAGTSDNIFHKPVRGWLHPDNIIVKKGVSYSVKYVGCLDVNTSMKSLGFDSRFQIAKECINRVCETAGLKTADRKKRIDKKIARSIGDHPNMRHAGSDVKLLISSMYLTLKLLDSDVVIATHEMPRISFASGGDAETLDFVAYVAKDANNWRACFVLECGGGLAQDVITTIGQAFDLRFKQFLTRPLIEQTSSDEREREYYNDLPGKVPPDVGSPPVPPLPSLHSNIPEQRDKLLSTNLIDLNCEVTIPPISQIQSQVHEYVNDNVIDPSRSPQTRDIFDMQPFTSNAIVKGTLNSSEANDAQLQDEIWYHGNIDRQQAELLLHNDGDFLVRESQGSPGQYVLTGIQSGVKKHLLLIDPEGVVRTKDRMFGSVSHLINYHCQNKLPIISAESALILLNPISKQSSQ